MKNTCYRESRQSRHPLGGVSDWDMASLGLKQEPWFLLWSSGKIRHFFFPHYTMISLAMCSREGLQGLHTLGALGSLMPQASETFHLAKSPLKRTTSGGLILDQALLGRLCN